MNKKYRWLFCLAALFFCLHGQSQTVETIRFTDATGKYRLTGYLYLPAEHRRFSLAVIVHSASEPLHTTPLYQQIKNTLLGVHTAVFIFDRRGSGESEGDFSKMSFEDQAGDVLEAVKLLAKRADINAKDISLIGISQGSWVVPIALNTAPAVISKIVLISTSAVSPSRQMIYGAQQGLTIGNYGADVLKLATYLRNTNDAYYRGQVDKKTAQDIIDKYRGEAWFPTAYLPAAGHLPDTVSNTKWFKQMDYDPAAPLRKINKPVLFFYGSYDRWSPIDTSIMVIRQTMKEAKNNNYEIFRLSKGGHMMTNDIYNSEDTVFSTEFTSKLSTWYKKN